MKLSIPTHRTGFKSVASWAGTKALALSFLLGSASAFAIAPAANTNIGNTASASFTDSSGNPTLVSSNPVVTVVQQVGSFTLDGFAGASTTIVNSKATTIGGTVSAPHSLVNTGNGTDSFTISAVNPTAGKFSKIEIFAADDSGNPSGIALCSQSTGACTTSPAAAISIAGSNGTYRFVVAYTVAGSATVAAGTYETSTVTVLPVPASVGMYTTPTASVKDEVTLSSGAAFSMTKSIAAPSVNLPQGNWPAAVSSGPASTSTTCATTWSPSISASPTADCRYTVYTLTFSNNGLSPGTFAFQDNLPAGFTYVANSAVWSSAGGQALGDTTVDPTGIDYAATATGFNAVILSLAPNQVQTLSFVVLINPQSKGTAITGNVASYNSVDAPGATTSIPGLFPSHTSITPYAVTGTYGVAVGSMASVITNAAGSDPLTPDATSANDNTVVALAAPGSTIKFYQKVYNTGDTTDTFNLKVDQSTFPAGTNFFFYGEDGSTYLNDTGALDNIQDTGPVAPKSSATVVVAAVLPTSLQTFGSVNYSVILTATSVNDPTKKDTTRDTLAGVSKGLVDLTNTSGGNGVSGMTGNGDVGPGPSPGATTTVTTTPGAAARFSLYVVNNDTGSRSYSLAASSSTIFPGNLPTGWTVKFVSGLNADCSAGSPITETGSIAQAQEAIITACVTPGQQQALINGVKIYFKVTATTANTAAAIASDIKTDAVNVVASASANYAATLVGNNTGQVSAGSAVVFSHILTNTGLLNCGAYTVQATLPPEALLLGWKVSVYLDFDGDSGFSGADKLITATVTDALLPGASNARKYLVRMEAPADLSPGATATATFIADFGASPQSCGAPSVIDQATVTAGTVRVLKTQSTDLNCSGTADNLPDTARLLVKPGNCIYYRVTVTNQGTAAVSNLTITDKAPSYTVLNAVQPAINCHASGSGNSGTFAFNQAGAQVTCGGVNAVNPSGTVTLEYSVIVDR